jgi:response regulator RpfG family c-di-GMP phosphodiesterase
MRKLLIVDDDEALRRLMRLELSDHYEVIDSGEPEKGLALALENRPEAILLDLRMPKYSGYDLLQTFTSFAHTQMIPVIVISGEGGGQTKEHCTQLGAAGYFEKPINFVALRTYLDQIATAPRYVKRSEVRVRLHVPLKLEGRDSGGKSFEAMVDTEDVSLSGFLCACAVELAVGSTVGVYTLPNGLNYVGKARIVHANAKEASIRHYGCCFIEKTGPWVLR